MFYYHKGLTRAARRTVATAITIAGRQGCTAVDTGHLLLAMLQTGRGTAVEFLRRKQITVTALSACASQRPSAARCTCAAGTLRPKAARRWNSLFWGPMPPA